MEQISYSAHISNKKSAITSKAKLAIVAKQNIVHQITVRKKLFYYMGRII